MEELAAFCGFDIERLTSMQRLLEHTVRLAQSQNILIISAYCHHCDQEAIFDTKLRIWSAEWYDPVRNQTIIDILSQVSVGALTSITLGMHHETDVAHCTTSIAISLTSYHTPSSISPSLFEESNGYHQSRFNRSHQKIPTQHRDQMYRSTSQPFQYRSFRNRKTNPRNSRPSPSDHQVSLRHILTSSPLTTSQRLSRHFRRTQGFTIHRSQPRRPPKLLRHSQCRYQRRYPT
jgi:hypothetical protein